MDTAPEPQTSLDELIARAGALLSAPGRSILGIAGPPGAGKSTLAEAVVAALQAEHGAEAVALLPMDGYHHTNAALDALGLRDVKGAPETFDVDAYVALLERVRNEPAVEWTAPSFSRDTDEPEPYGHRIGPAVRLVVTEGNYLLLSGPWAQVRDLCDEMWFVDGDLDELRERLVARQHDERGLAYEDAVEFAERSDLANARLVVDQSADADLIVRLPHPS